LVIAARGGGDAGGGGAASGCAGAVSGGAGGVGTSSLVMARGVAVLPGSCGSKDERAGALSGSAFWRTCATPGVAGSAANPTSEAVVIKKRKLIQELQVQSRCRIGRLGSATRRQLQNARQRFVRLPSYTIFFMSKAWD
jgi:hypothetical protein